MSLSNITVTITPEGGTPTEVTGSRAAYLAGAPTAVDALLIRWGRPTVRDHAEAGELRLTILTRDREPSALIVWGALVEVRVDIGHASQQLIGRGWINNIDRRRPAGGLPGWRWDLDIVDAIGRAAGHIVRSEPWAEELGHNRLLRLGRLGIVGIDPAGADWQVAPRDSDSQSLLALVHYTTPPGAVVGEHPDGLGVINRLNPSDSLPVTPIDIPADSVQDAGVTINRAASIIQAEARYRHWNATEQEWEERNIYCRTGDPRDGTRFSFTTDVTVEQWGPGKLTIRRWLNSIIAATAIIRPKLNPARLLPGPWYAEILPISARTTAPLIRLVGLPDWHGLDGVHHVTGGTIEATSGPHGTRYSVVVDLQPAAWDGIDRALWSDVMPPDRHRYTFNQLAGYRWSDYNPQRSTHV